MLHLIHHLHWNNPNKRILCNKIDVEKAYHHLHTRASVAEKCIAIWFLDTVWENKYKKSQDQVAILLTHPPTIWIQPSPYIILYHIRDSI